MSQEDILFPVFMSGLKPVILAAAGRSGKGTAFRRKGCCSLFAILELEKEGALPGPWAELKSQSLCVQ